MPKQSSTENQAHNPAVKDIPKKRTSTRMKPKSSTGKATDPMKKKSTSTPKTSTSSTKKVSGTTKKKSATTKTSKAKDTKAVTKGGTKGTKKKKATSGLSMPVPPMPMPGMDVWDGIQPIADVVYAFMSGDYPTISIYVGNQNVQAMAFLNTVKSEAIAKGFGTYFPDYDTRNGLTLNIPPNYDANKVLEAMLVQAQQMSLSVQQAMMNSMPNPVPIYDARIQQASYQPQRVR
jgi:hypothetical protein